MKNSQTTRKTLEEIKQHIAEFVPVMDGLSRARNPYELRYFVIGKHDDRVQQYKQAVIEMDTKYRSFMDAIADRERKALAIEKLEMKLIRDPQSRMDEITNREIELDIQRVNLDDKQTLIAMTGAFNEVLDFMRIIEDEFPDLVDKTEEELLKYETEYWKKRFTKQCHIDLMVYGKLGEGNRSAIEQLPKDMQREILAEAMMRTEEVRMFENKVEQETRIKLAESYPHKTQFIAPPDYLPVKLLKDAPEGYPPERILHIDRAEIMIASLHRPGDKSLSESFYIPAGKNYVRHDVICDRADMVGEWRNRIVKDALSIGCTHILFVDDDLIVENNVLQKLYAHDLDIVGGWYCKKQPIPESATMISVTNSESKQPVPKDATGLVEIDWVLTAGLTLVKTEVFKKLAYPWYMTFPQGDEDTYFAARCREAGIKQFLDTSCKAIHVDKQTMLGYSFDGVKPVNL